MSPRKKRAPLTKSSPQKESPKKAVKADSESEMDDTAANDDVPKETRHKLAKVVPNLERIRFNGVAI